MSYNGTNMPTNANSQSSTMLLNNTANLATGTFLEEYGSYLGGIVNICWIPLAIYLFLHIRKINDNDHYKKFYYAGPILLILLFVVDNIYYFTATKTPATKANVNSTYANIAFIPIYIAIFMLAMMVASHARF